MSESGFPCVDARQSLPDRTVVLGLKCGNQPLPPRFSATQSRLGNRMTSDTTATKTESASKPATSASTPSSDSASTNYSRGEGQKPVSAAYRDNWNVIFGKKEKPAGAKAAKS